MRIPKELQHDAARDFWRRNAPLMLEDGRLHDATRDGFLLLCETWGQYWESVAEKIDPIKQIAIKKQLQNQMAAFGMSPASRKRLKLDEKKIDIGAVLREAMQGPDAS